MKNYEEMSDFEINKAVSFALGVDVSGATEDNNLSYGYVRDICNDWSAAGPIILENDIGIMPYNLEPESPDYKEYKDMWFAMKDIELSVDNKNPLRAAMIVFLMMQEGKNATA